MSAPTTIYPWREARKVAVFVTSSKPITNAELDKIYKEADAGANINDDLTEDLHTLERIPGDFEGWTPYEIARDYVLPHLTKSEPPTAIQSFVILDDQFHEDGNVLIASINPDCLKKVLRLEVEGILRIEPEFALNLPIIFDMGIQGIVNYSCEDYDNQAEWDKEASL